MLGYDYISGIGGPGAQQSGGISPAIRSSNTAQNPSTNPNDPTLNPLSMGGYATTAPTPGFGNAPPSAMSALKSNSTYVPGFGYINNNMLTGGNTLNGVGASSFTSPQISQINQNLGGQHFGLNPGTGVGQGAQMNYGFNSGVSGAGGLGDSYLFGGQQYTPDNIQTALSGFNTQLMGVPDYSGLGGPGKNINYTPDWYHTAAGGAQNNGFTNLGSVYNFLAQNPGFQSYGQTFNGMTPQGVSANPFAAYYNDPSMAQYGNMATSNQNLATGAQRA